MERTIVDYFEENTNESGKAEYLVALPPKWKYDISYLKQYMNEIGATGIELTITFLPTLHERYNSRTLTQLLINQFAEYRKRYKFNLVLIGEFSKTGLYHMHGVLRAPPRMVGSIRRNFPKRFGRTEVKAIKFVETWTAYCLKKDDDDRENHKDIIENETIIF